MNILRIFLLSALVAIPALSNLSAQAAGSSVRCAAVDGPYIYPSVPRTTVGFSVARIAKISLAACAMKSQNPENCRLAACWIGPISARRELNLRRIIPSCPNSRETGSSSPTQPPRSSIPAGPSRSGPSRSGPVEDSGADCGIKGDGKYHCGDNCGIKGDGNFHCGTDCGIKGDGKFHCGGDN